MANRYNLGAEDWTDYKKIYDIDDEELDVVEFNSSEGFIIPDSDDSDNGFLFVLR